MFWMLPLNSRAATESVTCITMLQVSFSLHCGLNVPICLPRRMNVEFSLCLLTKFFLVHLTLCSLLTTDVEGNFMFDLIKAQSVLWCAQLVLQEVRLCSCLTLLNVNRDVLHLFPQSHYISLYCVCIELVSPCRLGISWRMALWHEKKNELAEIYTTIYRNDAANIDGIVQIQCALPLRGGVAPRRLDRWTGMTSCNGSYQDDTLLSEQWVA